MATSYKVQKGDTRSGIAKKLGVTLADIGLGKSGNPDLINIGEELQVGAPKSDASNYAGEMKSQLGDTFGTTKDTTKTDITSPEKGSDLYDITKLRTDVDTYKTKLDDSYKKLENLSQTSFEEEYANKGLAEKKTKIAALDNDIATEKTKLNEAIAKVRANPGLSAANMVGDIKKFTDNQGAVIANLVAQRNGLSSEYNAGLDEVDKAVERRVKDASTEYSYYSGLLDKTNNTLKDYSTALTNELKNSTSSEQLDEKLANALTIAQLKASDSGNSEPKLKLAYNDITGEPSYWYDDRGNIYELDGSLRVGGKKKTPGPEAGADLEVPDGEDTPAPAEKGQSWLRKLLPW